jgi:hypothetical protein
VGVVVATKKKSLKKHHAGVPNGRRSTQIGEENFTNQRLYHEQKHGTDKDSRAETDE